jgi:hypothetical protein
MLQEYCLVRESCFRCYRNIVWLEGVASDVTGTFSGLEGVASDVTIVWLEGVASDVTGILSG